MGCPKSRLLCSHVHHRCQPAAHPSITLVAAADLQRSLPMHSIRGPRAASGHAAATTPSSVITSRRLIRSPRRRAAEDGEARRGRALVADKVDEAIERAKAAKLAELREKREVYFEPTVII